MIAALLLALTVTRHTCLPSDGDRCSPAGGVCVYVGGIDPASTSVCVEPDVAQPGHTTCWSLADYGPCFPLTVPRVGQPWYRVRGCYTTENELGQYVSVCEPWVGEARLSCVPLSLAEGGLVVGGCDPEFYHAEGQP